MTIATYDELEHISDDLRGISQILFMVYEYMARETGDEADYLYLLKRITETYAERVKAVANELREEIYSKKNE